MYLLHNMSYWSRVGKQTVSLNKLSLRCNIWLLGTHKMGKEGRTYHPDTLLVRTSFDLLRESTLLVFKWNTTNHRHVLTKK